MNLRPTHLLMAIVTAFALTLVLTPLFSWAGGDVRKSAHLVLKLSFGLSLLFLGWRLDRKILRTAGLVGEPRPFHTWTRGFLMGSGALLAFILVAHFFSQRVVDLRGSLGSIFFHCVKYLPLALVIGVLEDLPFFGLAFLCFQKRVLPAAAFFALTHFLEIDKRSTCSDSTLLHGVEAVTAMFRGLRGLVERPMDFVGLFIVGWVLARLRRDSGTLWLGMGVHGGWYWVRMVIRRFSESRADTKWVLLFGTDKFYDGVFGWITLVVCGILLARRFSSKNM